MKQIYNWKTSLLNLIIQVVHHSFIRKRDIKFNSINSIFIKTHENEPFLSRCNVDRDFMAKNLSGRCSHCYSWQRFSQLCWAPSVWLSSVSLSLHRTFYHDIVSSYLAKAALWVMQFIPYPACLFSPTVETAQCLLHFSTRLRSNTSGTSGWQDAHQPWLAETLNNLHQLCLASPRLASPNPLLIDINCDL